MVERVDAPAVAAGFVGLLRAAGVPATPDHAVRFARSMQLVPPTDREALYWTARVTLAGGSAHLEAFDATFSLVFDAWRDPAGGRRGDPASQPVPGAEAGAPAARDRSGEPQNEPDAAPRAGTAPSLASPSDGTSQSDEDGRPLVLATASAQERLTEKHFAALDPREREQVAILLEKLRIAPPLRTTRRRRSHRHGDRLDLRATMRRGMRSGELVQLERRRRRQRPRRLVVLCDASGSMESYVRPYLLLLRSAAGADAEVFVFATRLTRLTRALRGRDADRALERAASAAPDWSGGTRIGAALGEFTTRYGRRGMARGAVVVILSDGWERDEPERVGTEMARLGRLAHRVIWVNPRKASPGYEPLVGGMHAALPHCDVFLSGHSLEALEAVVDAIGS